MGASHVPGWYIKRFCCTCIIEAIIPFSNYEILSWRTICIFPWKHLRHFQKGCMNSMSRNNNEGMMPHYIFVLQFKLYLKGWNCFSSIVSFLFFSQLKCFGSSYSNVGNDEAAHTRTLWDCWPYTAEWLWAGLPYLANARDWVNLFNCWELGLKKFVTCGDSGAGDIPHWH